MTKTRTKTRTSHFDDRRRLASVGCDRLAASARCPCCKAEPGQPCTWKRRPPHGRVFHLARHDVGIGRFNRAQSAFIDAQDEVFNRMSDEERAEFQRVAPRLYGDRELLLDYLGTFARSEGS